MHPQNPDFNSTRMMCFRLLLHWVLVFCFTISSCKAFPTCSQRQEHLRLKKLVCHHVGREGGGGGHGHRCPKSHEEQTSPNNNNMESDWTEEKTFKSKIDRTMTTLASAAFLQQATVPLADLVDGIFLSDLDPTMLGGMGVARMSQVCAQDKNTTAECNKKKFRWLLQIMFCCLSFFCDCCKFHLLGGIEQALHFTIIQNFNILYSIQGKGSNQA